MTDELYEPFAVGEIFADDVNDVTVINGVMRATLYSIRAIPPSREKVKVAVGHLIMPVRSARLLGQKLIQAEEEDAEISADQRPDELGRPSLLS